METMKQKEYNLKHKIIYSLIWKFAERAGVQIVSLVLSIVLARLLSPGDYGLVAILLVFITIADVFVNAGFSGALIQNNDVNDDDFSSVLCLSIMFSIIIYSIIFILSPYIANLYNMPDLCNALRVLAVRIPIAAINSVQQAYLSKKLQFKKFFYATVSGTISSAIIGIVLAYIGFSFWALIWQYLVNAIVNTLVLWKIIDWKPKLKVSVMRMQVLFNFGWKLLVSNLLNSIYNSLSSLFIGRFYSPDNLGYFTTGQKFPLLIVSNVNDSISSVLFPALASEQESRAKLKAITRRAMKISSYIMWPILLGLAACADSIISLIFTDKWLPAVPYLRIACITYGLWPLHTANIQVINAVGRSDIFLKMEVVKKILGVITLLISVQYGVIAIALSELITGVISLFINAYPSRYLIKYSFRQQIVDILPSFCLAILMALVVYSVELVEIIPIYKIVLQTIIGLGIYIGLSKVLKLENYVYIINYLKERRG